MCSDHLDYSFYFEGSELRSVYEKEFVSLWNGWLGKDNLHKLDEVTEEEWMRFNEFSRLLSGKYTLLNANTENEELEPIDQIDDVLLNYAQYLKKTHNDFHRFVIPKLNCIVAEDWDYTFIIWHKNNGALDSIIPLIEASSLCHFKS